MTPFDTPFDRAHAAMEADPGDEALRLALFHRLADIELFVLLEREAEGADLAPQVFDTEAGDFVLAFDSEERLAAFSEVPAPYAALPGRVVASMLAGHALGLGINLDVAPSAMLLPADALEWLAETLAAAPVAASGRPVGFHPPALPPGALTALLAALEAKFTLLAGLASHALLAGVSYEDGTRGHILAFLGSAEASRPALAKAAGEALIFSGLEAGVLDVTFVDPGEPGSDALLAAAQVIALPEPAAASPQAVSPPQAPGSDPSKPPILR